MLLRSLTPTNGVPRLVRTNKGAGAQRRRTRLASGHPNTIRVTSPRRRDRVYSRRGTLAPRGGDLQSVLCGTTCSTNPRITPSGSLSSVPARYRSTIGSCARSGRSSNSCARRRTAAGVPSTRENVASAPRPLSAFEPGDVQDRADGPIVELLILGGERVDHRGDQLDLAAVKSFPDECLTREHVCVGRLDVAPQERPRRRDSALG